MRSTKDWELGIEQSNKGNDDSWLTQGVELLNYDNTQRQHRKGKLDSEIEWNWNELNSTLDQMKRTVLAADCWMSDCKALQTRVDRSRGRGNEWMKDENGEWNWGRKKANRPQIIAAIERRLWKLHWKTYRIRGWKEDFWLLHEIGKNELRKHCTKEEHDNKSGTRSKLPGLNGEIHWCTQVECRVQSR